jgi:hypothetical protein
MELLELEISLSTSRVNALYQLKVISYPVVEHTLKTFTIIQNKVKHKVTLAEMQKIIPWATNSSYDKVRLKTWCFREDYESTILILEKEFKKIINNLSTQHNLATTAIMNGYKVQKIINQ